MKDFEEKHRTGLIYASLGMKVKEENLRYKENGNSMHRNRKVKDLR